MDPKVNYPQFGGAEFTDVYLGTNALRSILQSGLFSCFNMETQNQLSKLYTRIDLFNDEGNNNYECKLSSKRLPIRSC